MKWYLEKLRARGEGQSDEDRVRSGLERTSPAKALKEQEAGSIPQPKRRSVEPALLNIICCSSTSFRPVTSFSDSGVPERLLVKRWFREAFDEVERGPGIVQFWRDALAGSDFFAALRILVGMAIPAFEALYLTRTANAARGRLEALSLVYREPASIRGIYRATLAATQAVELKGGGTQLDAAVRAAGRFLQADPEWRSTSAIASIRQAIRDLPNDGRRRKLARMLRRPSSGKKGRPAGTTKLAGWIAYIMASSDLASGREFDRRWAATLHAEGFQAPTDPLNIGTKRSAAILERKRDLFARQSRRACFAPFFATSPLKGICLEPM